MPKPEFLFVDRLWSASQRKKRDKKTQPIKDELNRWLAEEAKTPLNGHALSEAEREEIRERVKGGKKAQKWHGVRIPKSFVGP